MDPRPLSLLPLHRSVTSDFSRLCSFSRRRLFFLPPQTDHRSTVVRCDVAPGCICRTKAAYASTAGPSRQRSNETTWKRRDETRRDERGQGSFDGGRASVRPFFHLLLFSPVPLSFFSCDSLCSFWRTLAPFPRAGRLYASVAISQILQKCVGYATRPRDSKNNGNVWKYILSNRPE